MAQKNLVIFGATGGVGRQLLAQALAAGHQVTAVVRNPQSIVDSAAHVVTADLAAPDIAALTTTLAGADAVLSCLGQRSTVDTGIISRGTRAIIEAMQPTDVRRLVVISAAPISTVPSPDRPQPPTSDPGDGFFMRNLLSPMVRAVFRKPYADLALMEDAVRASGLDWTIVRPPRLSNAPLTGTYRTAYGQNVRRGLIISRADVAHLMLRTLDDPQSIRQTIGVAY